MAVRYSRARVCGFQFPCQLASSYACPVFSWLEEFRPLERSGFQLFTVARRSSIGLVHWVRLLFAESVSEQRKQKKPTRQNTLRFSATSAYSLTSPPAPPGCSLFSHPIFSRAELSIILQRATDRRYAPIGVLAESVYGPGRMSIRNPPRCPALASRLGRSVSYREGRTGREPRSWRLHGSACARDNVGL
jgi:hypothetical protein